MSKLISFSHSLFKGQFWPVQYTSEEKPSIQDNSSCNLLVKSAMGSLGDFSGAIDIPDRAAPNLLRGSGILKLKNPLTALVVNNCETVRKVQRAFLGMFGVETVMVDNGLDAIKLVDSGPAFNLILIDMNLPVMDGPTTTRILREMGFRNKIVAVTIREGERDKQYFMEAGLDYYHVLPISIEKLSPILHEIDDAI